MAEAAEADDRDLLAGAGAPVAQRRVGRDAGAQQRRGDLERDALGDLDDEVLVDDDVIELVNGENGRTAASVEAARATAERTAQVAVVLRRNGFQKLMLYRLVYY